jgi:hypothetical protein
MHVAPDKVQQQLQPDLLRKLIRMEEAQRAGEVRNHLEQQGISTGRGLGAQQAATSSQQQQGQREGEEDVIEGGGWGDSNSSSSSSSSSTAAGSEQWNSLMASPPWVNDSSRPTAQGRDGGMR